MKMPVKKPGDRNTVPYTGLPGRACLLRLKGNSKTASGEEIVMLPAPDGKAAGAGLFRAVFRCI
jgi:hypothetical protein